MIIRTLDIQGFDAAIRGMRNPMDSWNKSDSRWYIHDDESRCFLIGEKDKELSLRLQKAGPEHCKHLRMIYVWADINSPIYWWKEMDTYRVGVEKVSCSTMHKLGSRYLTPEDFEHDSINDEYLDICLEYLNGSVASYRLCKDPKHKKEIWRGLIQALPECYLQRRTVCMSYAALRNVVGQREGHKLKEWGQFLDWAHTLENSWMIFE